jgi:hypothetical protein
MNSFFVSLFCFFFLSRTGEAFDPSKSLLHKAPHRLPCSPQQDKNNALGGQQSSSDDIDAAVSDNIREIQSVVGLTDAELKRIVSRVPDVKSYSSENAKACVSKLKGKLSLSDIEFKKKIVLRLPQCLGYDFEEDIGPSLSELQSSLNLSETELRSLVLKCPQIIGLEFSNEVEPKIAALRDRIGETIGDTSTMALKDEILKKPALLDLAVRGGVSPSKHKRS